MEDSNCQKNKYAEVLDWVILITSVVTFLYWFTGKGLFYSETGPVLSPFTSLSLGIMVITRLACRHLTTWSKPMSLALLGLVACGNFTSIGIQMVSPDLFLKTIPELVATSTMTSAGIILFCLYEMLVVLRKTPQTAFILDDILLHLALFPGGLSLLGHLLGVKAYMSSNLDPRVGISLIEMFLMASFAVTAVITNPNLFLWQFLKESTGNRIIFAILFINQYVAAFAFGLIFRSAKLPTTSVGIEFYIMLAGVLATLVFLISQAATRHPRPMLS